MSSYDNVTPFASARALADQHAAPRRAARAFRRDQLIGIQRRHVLGLMRNGQTLHLEHSSAGRRWRLSDGMRVADDVARRLVKEGDVVGERDTLFPNTPSQTWRLAR
jgi:hypothetical protein